jgi:hypothetical protein
MVSGATLARRNTDDSLYKSGFVTTHYQIEDEFLFDAFTGNISILVILP